MITKENILMIAQDAKTKDERYLTLDINVNIENAGGALVGSGEAQYWFWLSFYLYVCVESNLIKINFIWTIYIHQSEFNHNRKTIQ